MTPLPGSVIRKYQSELGMEVRALCYWRRQWKPDRIVIREAEKKIQKLVNRPTIELELPPEEPNPHVPAEMYPDLSERELELRMEIEQIRREAEADARVWASLDKVTAAMNDA